MDGIDALLLNPRHDGANTPRNAHEEGVGGHNGSREGHVGIDDKRDYEWNPKNDEGETSELDLLGCRAVPPVAVVVVNPTPYLRSEFPRCPSVAFPPVHLPLPLLSRKGRYRSDDKVARYRSPPWLGLDHARLWQTGRPTGVPCGRPMLKKSDCHSGPFYDLAPGCSSPLLHRLAFPHSTARQFHLGLREVVSTTELVDVLAGDTEHAGDLGGSDKMVRHDFEGT